MSLLWTQRSMSRADRALLGLGPGGVLLHARAPVFLHLCMCLYRYTCTHIPIYIHVYVINKMFKIQNIVLLKILYLQI